jgi:hypothetical protein
MDIQSIFILQFFFSVIVYSLIAKWFVSPWLSKKALSAAMVLLILPHTFRHVGMAFLVPNLNAGPLPATFDSPAAYGDLAAAILAIVAIIALRSEWRFKHAAVWIFNIIGTIDLLYALRQADALPNFGATWFIPAMFVPLLLVSHVLIFAQLLKRNGQSERMHRAAITQAS